MQALGTYPQLLEEKNVADIEPFGRILKSRSLIQCLLKKFSSLNIYCNLLWITVPLHKDLTNMDE